MFQPLLDNPTPDFDHYIRVLKGEDQPQKVPLVEIGIDAEILQTIADQHAPDLAQRLKAEDPAARTEMFRLLGYDYVPVWLNWLNHPEPKRRIGTDTAVHSREQRKWTEEGAGLITSWHEFEQFPWDAITPDLRHVERHLTYLPDGMKAIAFSTMFEHVFEKLIGFETMSYLMFDDPALVEAVFERWGQKVYDYYAEVISRDEFGVLFHADDMGYTTSTLISPAALRKLVLPWHKKYAALAHAHGKPFYLHSCGNLYKKGIIDDEIEDVGIDGFNSFQDPIKPVTAFKAEYGNRVATLGGVDMDKMIRMPEEDFRVYVRDILAQCMPGGRYAIGTGNTVANYVPVERFYIMLEEARKWH